MEYLFHELSNGIRVVYSPSHSGVAHLGVYINAGSRDETADEHGIAHFIEHMAFKGTRKRRAYHILCRLDDVGGDLNAFTTKEHTCLHASFLSPYSERAIELFSDILLNATFPDREIEKEKSVILDEINAYKDSPAESIFDDFEELIYQNHPIGRNILGSPDSLPNLSKPALLRFIKRNYSAINTVIAFVGSLPFPLLIRHLEKYFGLMAGNTRERVRKPFSGYQPTALVLEKDTHQTHAMMGTMAFPIGHQGKLGLQLLNNLLGGPGSNSRLNLSLRERTGYTYHVESNYQAYSDTGYFSIYMGTTSSDPGKTMDAAMKELAKLRKDCLGTLQLHKAKRQVAGQIALELESGVNEMLWMGRRWLYHQAPEPLIHTITAIELLTAGELRDIANEIFVPDRFSSLVYKSKPYDNE